MKTRYWAVRCGHSFAGGSIDTGLVRSAEATCANLERETPQVASSSSTQQRDADRVRNRHTTRSRSKTAASRTPTRAAAFTAWEEATSEP
jgi:hypothetical protein